jgi:hypothetical protein
MPEAGFRRNSGAAPEKADTEATSRRPTLRQSTHGRAYTGRSSAQRVGGAGEVAPAARLALPLGSTNAAEADPVPGVAGGERRQGRSPTYPARLRVSGG